MSISKNNLANTKRTKATCKNINAELEKTSQ